MMESLPAEYSLPLLLSSCSAFTPDRWSGSSSSLITKDMVTFLLDKEWLCGCPCKWPDAGRAPAAILHFVAFPICQPLFLISRSSRPNFRAQVLGERDARGEE